VEITYPLGRETESMTQIQPLELQAKAALMEIAMIVSETCQEKVAVLDDEKIKNVYYH
jgi:hypothetical protein